MKKDILIGCKIICPAVVTPMTITKEDELRRIIKWDLSGRLEYLG
jgi:hypothetical protein